MFVYMWIYNSRNFAVIDFLIKQIFGYLPCVFTMPPKTILKADLKYEKLLQASNFFIEVIMRMAFGDWIQIQLYTDYPCMTLDKLLINSVPQFPICKMGIMIVPALKVFIKWLYLKHLEQCLAQVLCKY